MDCAGGFIPSDVLSIFLDSERHVGSDGTVKPEFSLEDVRAERVVTREGVRADYKITLDDAALAAVEIKAARRLSLGPGPSGLSGPPGRTDEDEGEDDDLDIDLPE